MATRTRFARNFYSAVLGLGLLSLVFLGSPGCGCGEDNLREEGGDPERCCCTFEWLPPRIANGDDVAIVFQNVDAGLDPEATPALLQNVDFRVLETFTVCVNEEHVIGSQFELVLRDDATNEVYTSVLLIYDTRCEPVIEPLSNYVNLTSTDCGKPEEVTCCCEFEWLPGPNQAGDVDILVQGATAGLNPTITPSFIAGVGPEESEFFEVCVSFDHPIGAQFDLVIQQSGGGGILGAVTLRYDERCIPTLVPTTAFPGLNLTSEECGGEPLECCCNFRWLPPVTYAGNVNLTAENASPGLNVTITPTTINGVVPRTFYEFQVCINADHSLLDEFDLVIADSGGGGEVLRAQIIYRENCDADIGEMGGEPQALTTTDCGGQQLTCCCQFEWFVSNDPDWIVPASPWTVVLENVDPSLETATVDPTTIDFLDIPPAVVLLEVCVNAEHTLGAAMEMVVYGPDPTGGSTPVEILRVPMDWQPTCTAAMGQPSGPGLGSVINLCAPPVFNKPGR